MKRERPARIDSAARSLEEFEHDLGALGQLAHDVVEHVGGDRGRAAWPHFGGDRVDHLKIEVGGFEREFRPVGADEHVAENGNGVAPLHHAMDVAERAQQLGTLYGDLHRGIRSQMG